MKASKLITFLLAATALTLNARAQSEPDRKDAFCEVARFYVQKLETLSKKPAVAPIRPQLERYALDPAKRSVEKSCGPTVSKRLD